MNPITDMLKVISEREPKTDKEIYTEKFQNYLLNTGFTENTEGYYSFYDQKTGVKISVIFHLSAGYTVLDSPPDFDGDWDKISMNIEIGTDKCLIESIWEENVYHLSDLMEFVNWVCDKFVNSFYH